MKRTINGIEVDIAPGADLQGAYLQNANLRRADLQNAYLQGADLQGANLQGANLQGANLQGANLQGAYLRRADLQGANLRGADLQNANLQNANLQGADLQGANLRGAYLTGAKIGCESFLSATLFFLGACVDSRAAVDRFMAKPRTFAQVKRAMCKADPEGVEWLSRRLGVDVANTDANEIAIRIVAVVNAMGVGL